MQFMFLSIDWQRIDSLDRNSRLMDPMPANKSKTSIESIDSLFLRMLKSASFAKSVVGLVGRFLGA